MSSSSDSDSDAPAARKKIVKSDSSSSSSSGSDSEKEKPLPPPVPSHPKDSDDSDSDAGKGKGKKSPPPPRSPSPKKKDDNDSDSGSDSDSDKEKGKKKGKGKRSSGSDSDSDADSDAKKEKAKAMAVDEPEAEDSDHDSGSESDDESEKEKGKKVPSPRLQPKTKGKPKAGAGADVGGKAGESSDEEEIIVPDVKPIRPMKPKAQAKPKSKAKVAAPGPVQTKGLTVADRGAKRVSLDASGAIKSPVASRGKGKGGAKAQLRVAQAAMRTAVDAKDTAAAHWDETVPPSLIVTNVDVDELDSMSQNELAQLVRDERAFRAEVEESFKEYRSSVDARLSQSTQAVLALQAIVQNITSANEPTLAEMRKTNEDLLEQLDENAKKIGMLERSLEADMDGETAAEWRKRYEVARQRKRKAESDRITLEARLKHSEIDTERYRAQTVDLQRSIDNMKTAQDAALNEQAATMQKAATELLMQQAGLAPEEVDEEEMEAMASPLEKKMKEWKRNQEARWSDSEKQLLKTQLASEKSSVARLQRLVADLTRQCDVAAKQVEDAEANLEASNAAGNQVRRQMVGEKRKIEILNREIGMLEQAKILLQNELDAAVEMGKELEVKLSATRKDYFAAKRRAEAVESKFDGGGTISDIQLLRKEAANYGGQVDALQQAVEELKERLKKSEDERKAVQEKLRLERLKLPDVAAAQEIRKRAKDFMKTHLDRSGGVQPGARPASVIGMTRDRPSSEEPSSRRIAPRSLGAVRLRPRRPSE